MTKIALILLCIPLIGNSQPNCNIYKTPGDDSCYNACMIAVKAADRQGARDSQEEFDKATALCPKLDYAYAEKAVPFLKRGDLKSWKVMIDKAVELNPSAHLPYRAWCRFQFARDYRGALEDFKQLRKMKGQEFGYSQNGDYDLNIVEGICYDQINQTKTGIELIEKRLAMTTYSPGLYDYLHLGIMQIKLRDWKRAIVSLEKQLKVNDYLADTYFYLALAYREIGEEKKAKEFITKAKDFYTKGYTRRDPYTHPTDKIFLSDIEQMLR